MSEARYSARIYQDQRKAERSPVEMGAKGLLPQNSDAIDCTVVDISDSGARIELRDVDVVPRRFKLFVPDKHALCECRVVRQSGNEIGVEFENRIDLKSN